VKIKGGGDANLLLPNFCVASLVFSPFSDFKVVHHEHPLHFLLLLRQSCRSLRNVSFGGHILGLIKSAYHGWLSMMTSSGAPISGPPNLKPTTAQNALLRGCFISSLKWAGLNCSHFLTLTNLLCFP